MRTLLISALLFHLALASKIHIFGSEDAPIPYSREAIFANPMVVIFQSLLAPSFYRAALVPAGLKDDLLKTDPAFQDLAKVLYSDLELGALYVDITKFDNPKIFEIPLVPGDNSIVPSSFKVAGFSTPPLPLLFITYPEELKSFDIKNLKHFEHFDM